MRMIVPHARQVITSIDASRFVKKKVAVGMQASAAYQVVFFQKTVSMLSNNHLRVEGQQQVTKLPLTVYSAQMLVASFRIFQKSLKFIIKLNDIPSVNNSCQSSLLSLYIGPLSKIDSICFIGFVKPRSVVQNRFHKNRCKKVA